MNINTDNLIINFKGDIVVKLTLWFATELNQNFMFIYPLFCINMLPGFVFICKG